MKDYYAVLEITENASEEVIKAAYKALVKKYHPDNNPDEKMVEKMKEVNEAFDVLSNPEKRAKYDLSYRGNHAEKEDEEAQHFYDAPEQPKRNIKRMEPLDPDRLKVQGIKYCGGTLWESDEVSVYMNFRYKMEVLKSNIKESRERIKFSVDKDNYKLLMTIYDINLRYITEAFYAACSQMGMYEEEIEQILDFGLPTRTVKMKCNLAHYKEEYELLKIDAKGNFKKQLKELTERYEPSLFRDLYDYMNVYEEAFINAANDICTSYEMGLYIDDVNDDKKIGTRDLPKEATERFAFLMRLVEKYPYWKALYMLLLKEYGDENGNLQKFAAAYGLDLAVMKSKIISDFIKKANLNDTGKLHRLKEKMQFLSYSDEIKYRELCEKYAQNIINQMPDFSPDNVNAVVKRLSEFDKEFGYDSAGERKQLQNNLLSNFGINPKIHNKEQCEKNLQEIEKLAKEYHIDFSKSIDLINRNLEEIRLEEERIQRRKEEEERQRDIESRTVALIVGYNPREKTFKNKSRLFATSEEAKKFNSATEEISEACKKLSFSMTESEWDAQLENLAKKCKNYNYPSQDLLDGLKKDFREEDRKIRTFAKYEYPTREAAKQAENESEIIAQINRSTYKASVERLRKYKQANFQSKYAKDKTADLEEQIIRDYNNREADMRRHRQSAAAAVPKAIIGVVAVVATVILVILGIICFLFISRILGIVLFVLAFAVYQIKNATSKHHVYSKPENFEGIKVVDGKIIWLQEEGQAAKKNEVSQNAQPVKGKKVESKSTQVCASCGAQIQKNAKYCTKCGAKIQ